MSGDIPILRYWRSHEARLFKTASWLFKQLCGMQRNDSFRLSIQARAVTLQMAESALSPELWWYVKMRGVSCLSHPSPPGSARRTDHSSSSLSPLPFRG